MTTPRAGGGLEIARVTILPPGDGAGVIGPDLRRARLLRTNADQSLTLRFNDGDQTMPLAAGAAVLSLREAQIGLLRPGLQVHIEARSVQGLPTISQIVVGADKPSTL